MFVDKIEEGRCVRKVGDCESRSSREREKVNTWHTREMLFGWWYWWKW